MKPNINRQFFFYCCSTIIIVLLTFKGMISFISSSEFWSIYLAKHLLPFNEFIPSVLMKPLFHGALSVIHLIPLSDAAHIYLTKTLFTALGLLQFYFIYSILNYFFRSDLKSLLFSAFLFCSPMIVTNFDRIRSDQVALTLFLFYFWLTLTRPHLKLRYHLILFALLPLVGFKHIYFQILAVVFFPFGRLLDNFKKRPKLQQLVAILILVNFIIWGLVMAFPSISYFLNSFGSVDELENLRRWLRTEWFFIYLCTVPYVIPSFRRYIAELRASFLWKFQIISLVIVLVHPQKYPFFVASFLPLIYLSGLFFIQFLDSKNVVPSRLLVSITIVMAFFNLYLAQQAFQIVSTNQPQLAAISKISKIVTQNNLTYLDGMGVLPRGKNIGCFVSPDDPLANNACIDSLNSARADAVLITNRLMGVDYDFENLEKNGYVYVGPNLYVKKKLGLDLTELDVNWRPPVLIFSYEQMY